MLLVLAELAVPAALGKRVLSQSFNSAVASNISSTMSAAAQLHAGPTVDQPVLALNQFAPLQSLSSYLCAFHVYSNNAQRQAEAHHYCSAVDTARGEGTLPWILTSIAYIRILWAAHTAAPQPPWVLLIHLHRLAWKALQPVGYLTENLASLWWKGCRSCAAGMLVNVSCHGALENSLTSNKSRMATNWH